MVRYFNSFILLFVLLLTSCQNEGNIGDYYGQWALKSSSIGGEMKDYDNLYLSFQGKVVWAKRVNASNHTYNDVFGRFSHSGDSLIMVFSQQNEVTSPETLIEKQFGFANYKNVRVSVSITDEDMQMRSGNNYWHFKKY